MLVFVGGTPFGAPIIEAGDRGVRARVGMFALRRDSGRRA